jgi:hypothetical protein
MSTHIKHVGITLQLLRANKLFAKISKYVFAQTHMEYLGHVIIGDGFSTDPAKIDTVAEWATPQSVSKLRSFLGLTGYYRCFIQNYGVICRPLYDLLKKVPFHWLPTHEKAFQQLKAALIFAPVLALPNFNKPFILEADASGARLGVVLM